MSEIRANNLVNETGLNPVGFSSGLYVGPSTGIGVTININGNANFAGIITATKLYGDGSNLTGISAGAGGATGLSLNDSTKIQLGAGNDLQIQHDTSGTDKSSIVNLTGDLDILVANNGGINMKLNSSEDAIKCIKDGAVKLYHNGTEQCSTSASGLAFPAGKGIDFSATANASTTGSSMTSELLDWYEEGTWTPSITFGGTSAFSGGSMGSSLGKYTRIGGIVFANFDTVINNKGSSGGLIHINGLPFQSGGGSNRGGTCFAFNTWMNNDEKCSRSRMYLGDNRTYIQVLWNSLDNLNNSDCNTSGQFCGIISYNIH